jgi:hypothetical protein
MSRKNAAASGSRPSGYRASPSFDPTYWNEILRDSDHTSSRHAPAAPGLSSTRTSVTPHPHNPFLYDPIDFSRPPPRTRRDKNEATAGNPVPSSGSTFCEVNVVGWSPDFGTIFTLPPLSPQMMPRRLPEHLERNPFSSYSTNSNVRVFHVLREYVNEGPIILRETIRAGQDVLYQSDISFAKFSRKIFCREAKAPEKIEVGNTRPHIVMKRFSGEKSENVAIGEKHFIARKHKHRVRWQYALVLSLGSEYQTGAVIEKSGLGYKVIIDSINPASLFFEPDGKDFRLEDEMGKVLLHYRSGTEHDLIELGLPLHPVWRDMLMASTTACLDWPRRKEPTKLNWDKVGEYKSYLSAVFRYTLLVKAGFRL